MLYYAGVGQNEVKVFALWQKNEPLFWQVLIIYAKSVVVANGTKGHEADGDSRSL